MIKSKPQIFFQNGKKKQKQKPKREKEGDKRKKEGIDKFVKNTLWKNNTFRYV